MPGLQNNHIIINHARLTGSFINETEEYEYAAEIAPDEPKIDVAVVSGVQFHENKGATLTSSEKQEFNSLLKEHDNIFKPEREPTDFTEHVVDTGDNPLISMPCYRLAAYKKDFLRKELDLIVEQGINNNIRKSLGVLSCIKPDYDKR